MSFTASQLYAVATFPLFCVNLILFFAAHQKKRKCPLDILMGCTCVYGILYCLVSVFVSILAPLVSYLIHCKCALESWLDAFLILSYSTTVMLFFFDRYLATARPLFYKVRMRRKHAYVSITGIVTVAVTFASVVVALGHYKEYEPHNCSVDFRRCTGTLLVFILLMLFLIMACTYIAMCRALLHFVGRQMCIFRSGLYTQKERLNDSKGQHSIEMKDTKITDKRMNSCDLHHELSKDMALTKHPDSGSPFDDRRESNLHRFKKPASLGAVYSPTKTVDYLTAGGEFIRLQRMRCAYTLTNLISDMRFLQSRTTRRSLDLSQAKRLTRFMTIKIILHFSSWLPFVISLLMMKTSTSTGKIDDAFVVNALHAALFLDLLLPAVYAADCQPYRTYGRKLLKWISSFLRRRESQKPAIAII